MIEVQNWHKSFGKNHVLRGVNCRVETGEMMKASEVPLMREVRAFPNEGMATTSA